MRFRCTDFLTNDGEKPDRDHDSAFRDPCATREALLRIWEDGWARVFSALERLSESGLSRSIGIRGEAHSVINGINRQMASYTSHIGQIALSAKGFAGDRWQSRSVPRNRSAELNWRVAPREKLKSNNSKLFAKANACRARKADCIERSSYPPRSASSFGLAAF